MNYCLETQLSSSSYSEMNLTVPGQNYNTFLVYGTIYASYILIINPLHYQISDDRYIFNIIVKSEIFSEVTNGTIFKMIIKCKILK